MIQFIGIDTDEGEYTRKETLSSEEIYLSKSEQCPICVAGAPIEYLMARNNKFSWLPPENVGCVDRLDRGAGQVRTNGRLAFVLNIANIQDAISNAYANVTSFDEVNNHDYIGGPVDFHVVFSLAGGTGCGTFLDVAYLLRKVYGRSVGINGYAILPRAFVEMMPAGPAMINTRPNAYGAIQDLDFLMHLDHTSEPVTFNWLAEQYEKKDFANAPNPFDFVYLLDNETESGVHHNNVRSIQDVVGMALQSMSGPMALQFDYAKDQARICIHNRHFDCGGKHPWASSLGASEIVINGHDMAEAYAAKAMSRLLDRLQSDTMRDMSKCASAWVDGVAGDGDHVVDYLYDMETQKMLFVLDDMRYPETVVGPFCSAAAHRAEEYCEAACKELTESVRAKLRAKFSKLLKTGDGCLSSAEAFLDNVRREILERRSLLATEKKAFEEGSGNLLERVDIAVNILKQKANKIFVSRRTLDLLTDDLIGAVNAYVNSEVEMIRRNYACRFFGNLLEMVDNLIPELKEVKRLVYECSCLLREEMMAALQRDASTPAKIDLSLTMAANLEIRDEEIPFDAYSAFLDGKGLEDIRTPDELLDSFKAYLKELPDYRRLCDTTLEDHLRDLPQGVLRDLFREAVRRANSLLILDSHNRSNVSGMSVEQAVLRYYSVDCNLGGDLKNVLRDSGGVDCWFCDSGMKDRIVFCFHEYLIPAFAVSSLDEMKLEYERSASRGGFYHFDKNIKDRMDREEYSPYGCRA